MEYGGTTSVPAFLAKLWTLVEDPATDDIIAWDPSGTSFHIYDQGRLTQEVLHVYFKHNNMASFVRQLNMYGFRKILQVDSTGVKVDGFDMEFAHPFFQKGRDHLLDKIKRKASNPVVPKATSNLSKDDIHAVLSEVHTLKSKTEAVTSQLDSVKKENEALWRELAILRQKHLKQQSVLNKLVQFLVTVVGPRGVPPMKRKLMSIMPSEVNQSDQGPSRASKVSRQYNMANNATYKVEQPRTPASENTKGVKIQEVFDDQNDYMKIGDFSYPNIAFPQNEAASSSLMNTSSDNMVIQSPEGSVQVEDILDNPVIMENVAQGIRKFSAESSKKSKTNVPVVTVRDPIGTQPVMLNIPNVAASSIAPSGGVQKIVSSGASQGKQVKSSTKKAPGLKVKLPTQSKTTSQVVTIPNNSATNSEPVAQMAMALPGQSGMVNDVGGNLDSIEFDLESIKDLLSEGYNIDTNTLMGLFSPEGPVPSTPEHLLNLDENPIKLEMGDIAGNELIQYNPTEDLPSIFDLQDIPPVTDTEANLAEQNTDQQTLDTPLVTPMDGELLGLSNTMGSNKNKVKIKQEMEDVD